jgi:hypothetical protein
VKAAWALVLLLLVAGCTPTPQRWQVALTSPAGSYTAGVVTLQEPEPWTAGRSRDSAVAGVLSTQRLISAWPELVGADAVDAVVQTPDATYSVTLGPPQVVSSGAVRFPAEATSLPASWGAGALVLTIRQPLRDSVALQSAGWSASLTAGAGTTGTGVVAAPVGTVAVALDGNRSTTLAAADFVAGLPGRQGYLVTLVNRTPVATRVTVTAARIADGRLLLSVATSGAPPPPEFNRSALLIDGYSGIT